MYHLLSDITILVAKLRATYYSEAMDREHSDRLLATVSAAATKESSDPQAVLHRVYHAIIEGDFDRFSESVTGDVELNICGFGPIDGNWRGLKDVIAATRKNFEMLGEQKPVVEGMISQGDTVAVLLRESGVIKSTGQAYRIRAVQWFTFENGKIKKIDEIVALTEPSS
jgi:ketosteroid isomerase-like protein